LTVARLVVELDPQNSRLFAMEALHTLMAVGVPRKARPDLEAVIVKAEARGDWALAGALQRALSSSGSPKT
jgi:hypothetical protein